MAAMFAMATYAVEPVKKGEKVPDFTATDENGETWKLSDQRADYLVIYFYPAAFTGGCTAEACSYRDNNPNFNILNAEVIGISGDEQENLMKFKEHNNLNFKLLSDPDGKIAEIFGVPTGEGSTIEMEVDGTLLQLTRGVTASRWTFVIDANGKLIYKDDSVNPASDSESVLKFITTDQSRKSCRTN